MHGLHSLPIPGVGDVYFKQQPFYLTISENLRQHYSFDPTGRFLTGYLDGVNYRRGLGSNILRREMTGPATKTRHMLSNDESQSLIDDVHTRVAHIAAHVEHHAPHHRDLLPWLETILTWDYPRLCKEYELFRSIYKPISILPPDQYQAIVLQAAEGCSWNKCTFCTLYRDRKFRIKCPTTFRLHIQRIKEFFGPAIGLRKSIFLGDGNALIIPQQRLIELLRIVQEEFPIGSSKTDENYKLKGVYSFLDIFGAERKTVDEYRELRECGVKRIYVGLETGDDELFTLLNKPGSPEACTEVVQTIKQAGINVGVILLAGAGGDRFAKQHLDHSIKQIAAMGLRKGDLVYVSPLVLSGNEEYIQQMQDANARSLNEQETCEQVVQLKEGLRHGCGHGPKVSLYHIEEFIY
ncbi:MAG: radical SAM protein [Chloroflexi bacterium AL-W]|nr:radical SAM protein [Chloroflexi bacterium AL-N1]NOK67743.1 radical SAM protein [Chloroflexi bacterium AL-N10]NOK75487.1 radical SAM protein [Chloroflexi bacterium AL-N5]NOK82275.1 radical SAM protein [Chloroflexi bacterium AL-W]NOK90120.1 radical SAM protein [Chloroflexi bacterium AL-N15]